MGYDSNFNLTIRRKDRRPFDAAKVEKEISDISGYGFDESDALNDGTEQECLYLYLGDSHWYDSVEHLDRYFLKNKDLVCIYTREGENHDDTEEYIWKDGVRYDNSDAVYRAPLCDGETVSLATYDRESGMLSVHAVPAGDAMAEQERLAAQGIVLPLTGLDLFGSTRDTVAGNQKADLALHVLLEGITSELQKLRESSYIPFSSPSPSSTEASLKKHVVAAIMNLMMAVEEAKELKH